MDFPFSEVKPGDPVSAQQWNALVRYIKQALSINAGANVQLSRGAGGSVLSVPYLPEPMLARLTESLTGGGPATAQPQKFDGADWVDDDDMSEIHVADATGNIAGAEDDKFWVVFVRNSGQWEIVTAPGSARAWVGTLTTDADQGETGLTVNVLIGEGTEVTNVENPINFVEQDSKVVVLEIFGHKVIIAASCPED